MQQSNGPGLLRTYAPRTYVAVRRLLQGVTQRRTWSGRRQRLAENIGAYCRSTEKLRFTDTDCNGLVSNAVLAVCRQNARMEVLSDSNRAPVPGGAHFVIAWLQLDFLAEIHWPGTVKIGTRVKRVGRSSIVLAQALFLKDRYVATKSIVVLIDAATRRAIQLPPLLINALYVMGKNGLHNRLGVNFGLGNAIKAIRVRL
jgi:acyl-CoA thioester hydrolase